MRPSRQHHQRHRGAVAFGLLHPAASGTVQTQSHFAALSAVGLNFVNCLFPGFNAVYGEYFPEAPPTRSAVVSELLVDVPVDMRRLLNTLVTVSNETRHNTNNVTVQVRFEGGSFDNFADVLSVSTTHLERYMSVARQDRKSTRLNSSHT